jgi:hypothetical protein
MNMMEQVERAVYASLKVEGFSHQDFDLLNTFQKTQVKKMARAAIAAMREPNEAMFRKLRLYENHPDKEFVMDGGMWREMIDAALEETKSTTKGE